MNFQNPKVKDKKVKIKIRKVIDTEKRYYKDVMILKKILNRINKRKKKTKKKKCMGCGGDHQKT